LKYRKQTFKIEVKLELTYVREVHYSILAKQDVIFLMRMTLNMVPKQDAYVPRMLQKYSHAEAKAFAFLYPIQVS